MHEVTSVNMNKNQTELYNDISAAKWRWNPIKLSRFNWHHRKDVPFFFASENQGFKRFAERQLLRMKLQQLKWSSFGLPRCFAAIALTRQDYTDGTNHLPICSMYRIFTTIYPINDPNVGKYTIHGAYGYIYFYLYLYFRCEMVNYVKTI